MTKYRYSELAPGRKSIPGKPRAKRSLQHYLTVTVAMLLPLVHSPNSGAGTDSVLRAVDDEATTYQGERVKIDVLENDTGFKNGKRVSVELLGAPANGKARVNRRNKVVFTPAEGFGGTETLVYRVTDRRRNTATATVTVNVDCAYCSRQVAASLTLSWDGQGNEVEGYRVYHGATADTVNASVANIVTNFVTFDPAQDLGLKTGDYACFRVTAYSGSHESSFSEAACATL